MSDITLPTIGQKKDPKKGQKKNQTLIWLLIAFIAPVLLAKLVLSFNLYHSGSTNQGELLPPNLSYSSLKLENPQPKVWQLLYLLPAHCDEACLERLYILRQSHTALGPYQTRVIPLILTNTNSDISALNPFQFSKAISSSALNPWLDQQQIIVVDPLGNFVMRYGQVEGIDAHIAQGKALIADLRKLLKLSRVD